MEIGGENWKKVEKSLFTRFPMSCHNACEWMNEIAIGSSMYLKNKFIWILHNRTIGIFHLEYYSFININY